MLFLMTMFTSMFFSLHFIIKACLSVCGETTIYSTAMGDVLLLEREFNYLL